jgi:hypothetical protein
MQGIARNLWPPCLAAAVDANLLREKKNLKVLLK